MVKKVGKRVEGVQKFPRCMRGLLLLLVSLTIFSSFTVPAFGADYKLGWTSYASDFELSPSYTGTVVFGNGYQTACDSSTCKYDGSSITWSDSAHLVQTADIYACQFDFSIIGSFSSDDVITINYSNTLGGFKFNTATCSFFENGDKTSSLSLTSSSGSFSYTVLNNVDYVRLIIYSDDLTKSPTSTTPSTRFKVTFSVETQEVGLLKTILDFIKQIPEKIGNFFTELGNKISGFFDNLFNNIKDFFTTLFKPSDDYFENLRTELDEFFSDHLGIVYELPVALYNETMTIFTSFKSVSQGILYITVPAFEFYLFDHHYEIFEGGTFLLYQEGNMPWLDTVMDIAHVMIDIFLAIGFVRFVYKKVINKVGVEGGDEI